MSFPELFREKTVLELGCGVGLVGIALSEMAREVYLTDHDISALKLCQQNLQRNAEGSSNRFKIRYLDWTLLETILAIPERAESDVEKAEFTWTEADLEALKDLEVVLAADVIYDEPLTMAFFQALEHLMRLSEKHCVCYLSLEKRYNFTLADLAVACPAYSHFLEFLETETDSTTPSRTFKGVKISAEHIPKALNLLLVRAAEQLFLGPGCRSEWR